MTHDRDSVREEIVNYTIPFIIRHGRLVSIALALPQVVARAGESAMEQTTDLPVSDWLQTAFEVAVLTRSVAVGATYFDAVATAVSSPHGGRGQSPSHCTLAAHGTDTGCPDAYYT